MSKRIQYKKPIINNYILEAHQQTCIWGISKKFTDCEKTMHRLKHFCTKINLLLISVFPQFLFKYFLHHKPLHYRILELMRSTFRDIDTKSQHSIRQCIGENLIGEVHTTLTYALRFVKANRYKHIQ